MMTKSCRSRTPWRRPSVSSGANLDHGVNSYNNGSDSHDAWTSITGDRGYLLRHRAGSDVPVGPRAASRLSKGFTDREIAILIAVEQLGMVSAEQLARAFFNTHRSAYETLLTMTRKRFLVNSGVDPLIVRRAVGHLSPPRNPIYALDWNGAYLLAYEHNYALPNWRAATAALITTRLGHDLGVSEVWSYLLAAARASQEAEQITREEDWSPPPADEHPDQPWRSDADGCRGPVAGVAGSRHHPSLYNLSLVFRNERASLLIRANSGQARHGLSLKGGDRVLLQPDATFIFGISRAGSMNNATTLVSNRVQDESARIAEVVEPKRLKSPRWSTTLSSWRPSFLSCPPSTQVMQASEKLAPTDDGHAYYRALLLEMETGSNNLTNKVAKIKSYSRLIRTNQEAWTGAYGISPRVLVVVPMDSQVKTEALKWRLHYFYKQETAVLMTSLQTLARAYGGYGGYGGEGQGSPTSQSSQSSQGPHGSKRMERRHKRHSLIEQPCWLDVMIDRWKPLGEALGLGITQAPAHDADPTGSER